MMIDLGLVADRLLENARRAHFAGYDPFDMLGSRLFRATPLARSALARLAWTQLGKRLPVNLRPLLGVPRLRNPKGVALYVAALCADHARTGERRALSEALDLGEWLQSNRCDPARWPHACWGYPFDWQARAFFVPAGKPNAIATVYVARALFELGKASGREDLANTALDAADFIAGQLAVRADSGLHFAYVPGETALVHNASLWAAAWCVIAGTELGRKDLCEIGKVVAMGTVGAQQPDGSWVYGGRSHHRFVDGFHTGYNLESLQLILERLPDARMQGAVERGYAYYIRELFDACDTAKYYAHDQYPLDTHSFAQAVVTILRVGSGGGRVARCRRILERAVELLYLPRTQRFAYQRGRWSLNRVDYLRWTQAWIFYALSLFRKAEAEEVAHAR